MAFNPILALLAGQPRRRDPGVAQTLLDLAGHAGIAGGQSANGWHINNNPGDRNAMRYRVLPADGGVIHEYEDGRRVFVRKQQASPSPGAQLQHAMSHPSGLQHGAPDLGALQAQYEAGGGLGAAPIPDFEFGGGGGGGGRHHRPGELAVAIDALTRPRRRRNRPQAVIEQ